MTFTYQAGLDTPLNRCRRLIGDVDPQSHLLEDEDIVQILEEESNIYYAGAECLRTMATVSAVRPEVEGTERDTEAMLARADELERRGLNEDAPPFGWPDGVVPSRDDTSFGLPYWLRD